MAAKPEGKTSGLEEAEAKKAMAIPVNRHDLEALGYTFLNASHCSGCGAPIEWHETPNGKHMPFTVMHQEAREILTTHWADCPQANKFRRPKC